MMSASTSLSYDLVSLERMNPARDLTTVSRLNRPRYLVFLLDMIESSVDCVVRLPDYQSKSQSFRPYVSPLTWHYRSQHSRYAYGCYSVVRERCEVGACGVTGGSVRATVVSPSLRGLQFLPLSSAVMSTNAA